MKFKFSKVFFVILIAVTAFGCLVKNQSISSNNSSNENVISDSNTKPSEISWDIKKTQPKNQLELQNIAFVDDKIGFAVFEPNHLPVIYQTKNGGKSWSKVGKIDNFCVFSIFFLSANRGFAVGIENSPPYSNDKFLGQILKTDNGGKSWEIVYSEINADIGKIVFNSGGVGLTVGRKLENQMSQSSLILMTTDDGQSWVDTSDALTANMKNKSNLPWLTNVLFLQGESIGVLSMDGKIFQSENLGKTWTQAGSFADDRDQTGFGDFGKLSDGRFWIAGGAGSVEGTWSMLVIEKEKDNWEKYLSSQYSIFRVVALPNNEFIACGQLLGSNHRAKDVDITNNNDEGVILSSVDYGKTWNHIYQSKETHYFSEITKLSENQFLVSGENGAEVWLKYTETKK